MLILSTSQSMDLIRLLLGRRRALPATLPEGGNRPAASDGSECIPVFSMSAICVLGFDTDHLWIMLEAEICTDAGASWRLTEVWDHGHSWRFEAPMAAKGISTHVPYPILFLHTP
jgi:hypothetical protein